MRALAAYSYHSIGDVGHMHEAKENIPRSTSLALAGCKPLMYVAVRVCMHRLSHLHHTSDNLHGQPVLHRAHVTDHLTNSKHAHCLHRFLAWIVRLPPEQSDPRYAHVIEQESSNSMLRFKKVHFVKCLYMLSDFNFLGITFMTAVNIVALLLTHEGSKLLLVVCSVHESCLGTYTDQY
jgi:hypothetical protein